MTEKPKVVCLVGPTACRKTEVSIALAKRLNGEIVSADSVAVYRGLDIGSAKPTVAERDGIPHYMLDAADITDTDFTVAVFREKARAAIDDILARGKLPIIVGGSGLYADAIFSDMRFCAPSDPCVRAAIEKDYAIDAEAVFARLKQADAVTAARLHIHDAKRVIRALEVYEVSGKPFSALNESFQKAQEAGETYDIRRIGLTMPRALLYDRIEKRVDRMMKNGLQQEAYELFAKGLTPDRYTAMQSIGYAQLYDAYCGRCTVEDAVAKIKLDTRHFAKRQMTWFRRNPKTVWFGILPNTDMRELLDQITEEINRR